MPFVLTRFSPVAHSSHNTSSDTQVLRRYSIHFRSHRRNDLPFPHSVNAVCRLHTHSVALRIGNSLGRVKPTRCRDSSRRRKQSSARHVYLRTSRVQPLNRASGGSAGAAFRTAARTSRHPPSWSVRSPHCHSFVQHPLQPDFHTGFCLVSFHSPRAGRRAAAA